MRVLVVGSGGREHALVWKLAQSPEVQNVFCAPGNAGTARHGQNVRIAIDDHREFVRFAQRERIDLVVIGPEAPLVAGLADDLRRAQIRVFGPSKEAALLEGSKVFCKRLLRKSNVPTAEFNVFREPSSVETYLAAHPGPCVVKADGLAAGKGVIVCDDAQQAREAAKRMLARREFGDAGSQILIEERLVGREASVLAITDGSTIAVLDPCQDYKRAYDGDLGPNTGGMGAYCPAPTVTPESMAVIERDILVPVVHFLRRERRPFQGVLYAGLMLTSTGPKVLEFNVRFGDPECQPLLMRLKSDFAELLLAVAEGRLDRQSLEWDPRVGVCVVVASEGYPGPYKTGVPIHGLDEAAAFDDVMVFHAGTTLDDERVVTSGGRVLAVTALGANMHAARARAYEAAGRIRFTGARYRRDIAADAGAVTAVDA
jgi:phosphoribosylamine--glycine ligase